RAPRAHPVSAIPSSTSEVAFARTVPAVAEAGAPGTGKWGPPSRPGSPPGGGHPRWKGRRGGGEGDGRGAAARPVARGRGGAGGGGRVRGAAGAAPPGAAGALLPDARILPRRRGRPPKHAADRLAKPRRVRGTCLDSHLAVQDRHPPVPRRAPRSEPPPG